MKISSDHYNVFKNNIIHDQSWAGHNLQKFVLGIDHDYFKNSLEFYPSKHLTRRYLFELIKNDMIPTEVCLNSILIWGGIKRDHFRMMMEFKDTWIKACEEIRYKKLSRDICYETFQKVRSMGCHGIGPAYFTKLIYFMSNNYSNRGYIMDQWTSRSINLLFEDKIIKLTRSGKFYYVNDSNNGKIYEKFCSFIDQIADDINVDPDLIELNLFSKGGREKGLWRDYVIQNHNE